MPQRLNGIDIEGLTPLEPLDPARYDMDPVTPYDPEVHDFEIWLHSQLKNLTRNQRRYIIEYGYDQNPRAAAARAGMMSPPKSPAIDRILDYYAEHRAAKLQITADKVLYEVAMLAESSIEHYMINDEGNVCPAPGAPVGVMRAIQRIKRSVTIDKLGNKTYTCELQLWNKIEPLRLLGRHVGLFKEAMTLDGEITEIKRIERVIVDQRAEAPK